MESSLNTHFSLKFNQDHNHNWLEIVGACVVLVSSVGASIVKAKVKEGDSKI